MIEFPRWPKEPLTEGGVAGAQMASDAVVQVHGERGGLHDTNERLIGAGTEACTCGCTRSERLESGLLEDVHAVTLTPPAPSRHFRDQNRPAKVQCHR